MLRFYFCLSRIFNEKWRQTKTIEPIEACANNRNQQLQVLPHQHTHKTAHATHLVWYLWVASIFVEDFVHFHFYVFVLLWLNFTHYVVLIWSFRLIWALSMLMVLVLNIHIWRIVRACALSHTFSRVIIHYTICGFLPGMITRYFRLADVYSGKACVVRYLEQHQAKYLYVFRNAYFIYSSNSVYYACIFRASGTFSCSGTIDALHNLSTLFTMILYYSAFIATTNRHASGHLREELFGLGKQKVDSINVDARQIPHMKETIIWSSICSNFCEVRLLWPFILCSFAFHIYLRLRPQQIHPVEHFTSNI